MPDGCHPKNRKMAVSLKLFNRSAQNLARMLNHTDRQNGPAVKLSNF